MVSVHLCASVCLIVKAAARQKMKTGAWKFCSGMCVCVFVWCNMPSVVGYI